MTAPFDLTGRTALVTGSSRGIGRAAALALAVAGADVLTWTRTGQEDATTRDVRAAGRSAQAVGTDMADPAAVAQEATRVLQQHQVDVLVSCAGIIRRAAATETTAEDWRAVMTTNLESLWALTQVVGSAMVDRGSGSVVSVASLLSFQGGVRVPAYAASKHAVAGLTKALANEWAGSGVTVNAVAPGYITTDNTAALRENPEREASIRERIPAGRWGQPEDVAGAVVFLASPAARYVNGHVLVVDGGWMGR